MAQEFKNYLSGFTSLCDNYCENAKKVVPDPDFAKVINIYQKGLAGSCAGLVELMRQHYGSANAARRRQIDEFVRLSGVLPLLAEANRAIGKNSLGSEALASAGGIFKELKKIVRFIPGLAQLAIPFLGAIPGLLDFIDQFVDGIGKLVGSSQSGGQKIVEHPPPRPTLTLEPCKPEVLPIDPKGGTFRIYPFGGVDPATGGQFEPEIEITVDGHGPEMLDPYKPYTGKSFKVHLKPNKKYPKAPVEIGWDPSKKRG
jgi:hypothetical protein